MKYKLLYLLAFAAGTTACTGTASKQAVANLVTARFEQMNRHDTNAVAALFADTAKISSPNWEGVKTGPAGAREVYRRYFTSSPDIRYTITRITVSDSAAVVEYTCTATLSQPENGTPDYMRGKKYTLLQCTRMNIHDGKITSEATYFDQVSFLRQVGFFEQH